MTFTHIDCCDGAVGHIDIRSYSRGGDEVRDTTTWYVDGRVKAETVITHPDGSVDTVVKDLVSRDGFAVDPDMSDEDFEKLKAETLSNG